MGVDDFQQSAEEVLGQFAVGEGEAGRLESYFIVTVDGEGRSRWWVGSDGAGFQTLVGAIQMRLVDMIHRRLRKWGYHDREG